MFDTHTYTHTNGRKYKVRTGPRNGKFIIVMGKKIYLKNLRFKGGANDDDDSDAWLNDIDDDEAFAIFCKEKAQQRPAIEIIESFLKNRQDYVVIGGKAAAHHMKYYQNKNKNSNTNTNKNTKQLIAESTNDYDVAISKKNVKQFIDELKGELCSSIEKIDHRETNVKQMKIWLFGKNTNGILDSMIDVHVYDEEVYQTIANNYVTHDDIRYASYKYVCQELSHAIKNYASNDETFKTIKRCARFQLLKCENDLENIRETCHF